MRKTVALLLLAVWPLVTSHVLLEHSGLIHAEPAAHQPGSDSHEHDADHHEFADGGYVPGSGGISLIKPMAARSAFHSARPLEMVLLVRRELFHNGPAPPGTAPPELSYGWQFFIRAALPIRAPTFIS